MASSWISSAQYGHFFTTGPFDGSADSGETEGYSETEEAGPARGPASRGGADPSDLHVRRARRRHPAARRGRLGRWHARRGRARRGRARGRGPTTHRAASRVAHLEAAARLHLLPGAPSDRDQEDEADER